jgi:Xaa-Pro aminopeptidase
MDYAGRIARLREEMQNQGVAGVFIPLDASFEYFTGVPRIHEGNTKHRQNSAEYNSLLITETEVICVISRLTGVKMMANALQYPALNQIISFPDADLSGETFVKVCQKMKLKGQKLSFLQDISASLVLRLQAEMGVSWINFDPCVQKMRAIKNPEELLIMSKAAKINDKIYSSIFPKLLPGVTVEEITREIDRLTRVYGAEMTSFTTSLMNFGPKEGKLYGDYYPVLRRGYVLAFDYGILYEGYCSDFGRTIFIGEPEPDLIKAHELIMKAQKEAIAVIKAGQITGAELNQIARRVLAAGGYDKEFGHRLGHGIGKDVHERPFLAEGEERILEEGMCFTVEPSILLPNRAIIRVEDVVAVMPKGGENFNSTTRELVVIE